MNDHPFFFITRCMCCKAEIKRAADPALTTDTFSDGLCRPLCDLAKPDWAQYTKKEHGGDL